MLQNGLSATVILAGTGRSGTTWLAEAVCGDGRWRLVFEPFHPEKVDLVRNWNSRQYLRPDDRDPRFIEPAARILSGKVSGPWVDRFNMATVPRRRLIKDIRANLLLPWIHSAFPDMRIVLLLRHPCAVAASKLALRWGSPSKDFLSQVDLLEDYLHPVASEIAGVTDRFESHIFSWCVENFIPLRHFVPGQCHVVFYEHCVVQPLTEVANLLRFIHEEIDIDCVGARLGRPSKLTRPTSPIVKGGSLVESWRKDITRTQIDRAIEILSRFGLERVYGASSYPRVSGEEALEIMTSVPATSRLS